MKPHVYLAGAINGKSDEEANGWRREAAAQLGDLFDILDPMARDYRGMEAQNVEALVEGDLTDISNCAVILVRAEAPSWGTAMELVYAHREGRTIIGFGAGERPSPWLVHHATQLVPDLSAAIEACRELITTR